MNLQSRVRKLEASQPVPPLVLTPADLEQAIVDLEKWDREVDSRADEWTRHCEANGMTMQLFPPDLKERFREWRRQRMRALQGAL